MSEISPRINGDGVGMCSGSGCPFYDRDDDECKHDSGVTSRPILCYPAAIAAFADSKRLDWMNSHHFTAYHGRDPEYGMESHCVVVDEDQPVRRGCVGDIREAVDEAIQKAVEKGIR